MRLITAAVALGLVALWLGVPRRELCSPWLRGDWRKVRGVGEWGAKRTVVGALT
jgi:hypothetical protein